MNRYLIKLLILFIIAISIIGIIDPVVATTNNALINRLKGHILLQVESRGEAWYVNPDDGKRKYMKDGETAYQMMRSFGLGINDHDLTKIPSLDDPQKLLNSSNICNANIIANRLKGKILLQVQQHGEAWYIYPNTCRRIYLKDGDAAYQIMRYLGLGINDADLSKIAESPSGITFDKILSLSKLSTNPNSGSSTRYIKNYQTYIYNKTEKGAFQNTGKIISKGTQVIFISEDGPFFKIEADNQIFWILGDLVNNEPSAPKLSEIIKKWRPIVAYVECDFRDTNTNELYSQLSGSGVVVDFGDGQITVITNKHIVADNNGYQPFICRVKLPDDNNAFIIQGKDISAYKTIDIGLININNPDEYLRNLTSISTSPLHFCKQKPSVGESVLILGYPSIGSRTDITATEGIISGFDGNYFITSAKIEHGNSGGVAILLKDDCYLGIPTAVVAGELESLGRILDINSQSDNR